MQQKGLFDETAKRQVVFAKQNADSFIGETAKRRVLFSKEGECSFTENRPYFLSYKKVRSILY